MVKNLPNKWVRKAISDLINGITVNGRFIPCYDYRVTGPNIPDYYTIMTTQSNEVDMTIKCGYRWESSILIEIFTRYPLPGNPGSRVLADDILDEVRELLNILELDEESDLEIIKKEFSFPSDLVTTTSNENVFRNFIRLNLLIN